MLPPSGGGSWSSQAVIVPADGCVLIPDGSGGPASELRMFYHCGVLLAVDATTHGYMPSLPAASPAEQALAARIAGAAWQAGRRRPEQHRGPIPVLADWLTG